MQKDILQRPSKAGCMAKTKMGKGCSDPEGGVQKFVDAEDQMWKAFGEAWDQKALIGTDGGSLPNIFPLVGCLCLALSALCLTT